MQEQTLWHWVVNGLFGLLAAIGVGWAKRMTNKVDTMQSHMDRNMVPRDEVRSMTGYIIKEIKEMRKETKESHEKLREDFNKGIAEVHHRIDNTK